MASDDKAKSKETGLQLVWFGWSRCAVDIWARSISETKREVVGVKRNA